MIYQSLLRYILIAISAALVKGLIDFGFDPADAEQFGQAFIAFGLAAGVLYWSVKKNKNIETKMTEKDARIKKLETDPINWRNLNE